MDAAATHRGCVLVTRYAALTISSVSLAAGGLRGARIPLEHQHRVAAESDSSALIRARQPSPSPLPSTLTEAMPSLS